MKPLLIDINDFKGGMSLLDRLARKDQFHIGNNLDFLSKKGLITNSFAWTQMVIAGMDPITVLFPWMVFAAKDDELYLGGDNTKIYKQTDVGTFTEQHDDGNAGGVKGMVEFKEFLLWASDTIIGTFDFASTFTDSFKVGLQNVDHHMFKVSADGKLYFGNGRYVGVGTDPTNNATFNLTALDLGVDWNVRCLEDFGADFLAVGASFGGSKPVRSKIWLWNRTDSGPTDEIDIPEDKIKAMKFKSGYLWIIAGKSCNIYVVPVGSRVATLMHSFTRNNPKNTFEVLPGAIIERDGLIYFGLSDVDTNSDEINPCGIYTFPVDPNRFILNIPRKVNGFSEEYKGLGFYSISGVGNILYTSRDDGSIKRIERELLFDSEAPYADSGNMETVWFDAPPNMKMETEAFGIEFDPLPAGSSIALKYKLDGETSFTNIISSFSISNGDTFKIIKKKLGTTSIKLRLSLDGSAVNNNFNRPFVKRLFVTGHLKDRPY